MSSRPAGGGQPPPQNRNPSGGTRVAQPRFSSALGEARKSGLAVELTGDEDKLRLENNDSKSSVASNSTNQPLPVDSSGARSAAMDRQVSNATPAVLFPPRPGHYTLENFVRSLLSGEDASGLTKRESRSQAQEPPSESLQLPNHSTMMLIFIFGFGDFANVQNRTSRLLPMDRQSSRRFPYRPDHQNGLSEQTCR